MTGKQNNKSTPLKLKWKTPTKPEISTGHKAFDRFCNYLGTANVLSDGQFGACIRPRTGTECNGRSWPPGELRDFDLKPFRTKMPPSLEKRVLEATETQGANLSMIFHYNKDRMIVHGFILSTGASEGHRLILSKCTGPTRKSQDVIDWVAKRISTPSMVDTSTGAKIECKK